MNERFQPSFFFSFPNLGRFLDKEKKKIGMQTNEMMAELFYQSNSSSSGSRVVLLFFYENESMNYKREENQGFVSSL